ncbi:MAG: hypothetical protein HGA33_03400 [Candidatus Moranbacteria bacterium]|nr:hypothetical protein [Candidatus Moranbacteria bacterium]
MPVDRNSAARKRCLVGAVAGAIIVTAIAVYYFVVLVQVPSWGVTTSRPITSSDFSSENGRSVFDGSFFSIGIAPSFMLKRHDDSVRDGAILEQTYFSEPDLTGRKIAVTIERLVPGGITESTSYRFRSLNPESYRKDTYRINNVERTIFIGEVPVYEIVGYIEGNEIAAVISLTSATKTVEELMPDFLSLVSEFRWRTRDESM